LDVDYDNYFGDNGALKIDYDATGAGNIFEDIATLDDVLANSFLVFYEDADNSGVFTNTDDDDQSSLQVLSTAKIGTSATFTYNDESYSYIVANDFGTIDMDESTVGVEWNSGETLAVTLVDQDLNKNTLSNEDIVLTNSFNSTIPSLQIGSPITLSASSIFGGAEAGASGMTVGTFNKIATLTSPVTALATDGTSNYTQLSFNGTTIAEMRVLSDAASYVFANYDVTQLVGSVTLVALVDASGDELHQSAATTLEKGMVQLSSTITATGGNLV